MNQFFAPQLIYVDGKFIRDKGLLVDERGSILGVVAREEAEDAIVVELDGKALLPGFVNAHSHTFQRLIRGKAESRRMSGKDFWSWRGTMYRAAAQLTPGDVFDVARMTFLEMLLAGTTTVGEFHYLHADPTGRPYDDPNLLCKQVIAAAESVGMRIVLLRTAYQRSGFDVERDPGQTRFFETTTEFLRNTQMLVDDCPNVRVGVAPHSVRAVGLADIEEIANWAKSGTFPLHMHVAEQVAENAACVREYGCTPVQLLHRSGVLSDRFTAVHAIHVQANEIAMMAEAGSMICSCPTTERNLGDGILAADLVMAAEISVAFGSDSQAQIHPLEDARELDYHLRLRDQQRAVLDGIDDVPLAQRLFDCASRNGAKALMVPAGEFAKGKLADGFTVELDEISIAGCASQDLLPMLVFSLGSSAVRDVIVEGKLKVSERQHPLQREIVARYLEVHDRVWGAYRSSEREGVQRR